jgi:hypothetical protein
VTSIIAFFVIALVSLIAVRVGSTALMMTGLSYDTASFQAYSAFFGVGFTTREAEMVVNHPVRRRIIRDLILAGNVGLTSALATLVVTLMQSATTARLLMLVGLAILGLISLLMLSKVGSITPSSVLWKAPAWSARSTTNCSCASSTATSSLRSRC